MPKTITFSIVVFLVVASLEVIAHAAEHPLPVEAKRDRNSTQFDAVSSNALRAAVARSLPLIESSGAEYRRQRQCFSCHHQALPVLAVIEARRHGFEIDEANLEAQLEHTAAHLKRGRAAYADGRGQGGQVDTAGWALWALDAAECSSDDTTSAVANYLLTWQNELGHWRPTGRGRVPTQGSDFTATYLALHGLSAYATAEQATDVAQRKERVKAWLVESKADETEDQVFRLRSLYELDADETQIAAAAMELVQQQRDDGGWAQTTELTSDAYATGTVLCALFDSGAVAADDVAFRRGVAYLVRNQLSDGSWHVATRAKPIQVYFESGFPHGKDQFISMSATCWATIALLKACSDAESDSPKQSTKQEPK
jgi:N-acyl-D-amino-acid deacylase